MTHFPEIILDEETQELWDKIIPTDLQEAFNIAREREKKQGYELAKKWRDEHKERSNEIAREGNRVRRLCTKLTKDIDGGIIIENLDFDRIAQFLYEKDYCELTERRKTIVRKQLRKNKPRFEDLR